MHVHLHATEKIIYVELCNVRNSAKINEIY